MSSIFDPYKKKTTRRNKFSGDIFDPIFRDNESVLDREKEKKGLFDFNDPNTLQNIINNPIVPRYEPKEVTPYDIVSAGLYSSTKFLDSMATKGYSLWDIITPFTLSKLVEKGPVTFIKDIGTGLGDVGTELGSIFSKFVQPTASELQQAETLNIPLAEYQKLPTEKRNELLQQLAQPQMYSTSDLIEKHNPTFAKEYPVATTILGFIGDVALDPTTFVSFESALPRYAGRKLTKEGIGVIRELNELAESGFRATLTNKGVPIVVDFGPHEVRQLRYLEDSLGTAAAESFLQKHLSTYGNLNTLQINLLDPVQRQNTVENNFMRLVKNNPKLAQEEGLGVFYNIPFVGEIPLVNTSTVNKILEKTGLDKLYNAAKENLKTPPIEAVRYGLQRDYNLPDAFVEARHQFEGKLNVIDHQILSIAERTAKLSADSRLKLTELASKIDTKIIDKTANNGIAAKQIAQQELDQAQSIVTELQKQLDGATNFQLKIDAQNKLQQATKDLENAKIRLTNLPEVVPLSDKAINMTRQYWINEAVRNGKLSPEEFDVFTRFTAHSNTVAQIEKETKLYAQAARNYEAGLYFGSKDRTKFFGEGLDDAISKGFVPEMDFAALYAMKMKTALYRQERAHFKQVVDMMFDTPNGVKIPDAVKADLDFIGQTFYASNVANMTKPIGQLYDKGLAIWKTLAYAVKPASAVKQYMGNMLQGFTKIGPAAFKSLDPRRLLESMIIMSDKSAYSKFVPKLLIDGVQEYGTIPGKMMHAINRMGPALVDKVSFRNRLGERIDGPAYMQELLEQDIYHKGSNILDIETTKDLKLEIAKANGWVAWQKAKWKDGFWTFFKESLPWINMPSHVETIQRLGTYHNARMMGYLPAEAKKLTNEALFDYAHGLSRWEKTWGRRIVPFYTFQRFAIPLIGSLVKNPGRANTLKKITEAFFEVWEDIGGDQKLTDAQRQVLPGYLLSQPTAFEGINPDGTSDKAIFRTFNNFTYTDMLSLIKTKDDGSIDIGGSIQKMTLAQVTPLLKVPVELLVDKNFFTDQVISKGGKIASGDKVDMIKDNLPDLIKKVIDYEERPDPITGEKKAYINPYITYLMSAFVPAINDYIRITRDDLNAHEFAMQYFGGVGTVKVDFEQARRGKIYEWRTQIRELQKEMRRHYLTGDAEVINEDQKKLQELIKQINKIQNLNLGSESR